MLMPTREDLTYYFCLDPVDMRKSINGLSALVIDQCQQDPTSGHLFFFRNRHGDKLKALYFERDSFSLWYRRLERGRYKFPKSICGTVEMDEAQLRWLLDSFDFANLQFSTPLSAANLY